MTVGLVGAVLSSEVALEGRSETNESLEEPDRHDKSTGS